MKIVDRDWDPAQEYSAAEDSFVIWWKHDRPVGHSIVKAGGAGRCPPLPPGVPEAPDASSSSPADVSVVICTRDRPVPLAACLAALARQTVRPREVIVVDNASVSDDTRLAALAANVSYVREDRPGLDYARNAGALAASGDIVAYTDDDVVLHPRWIERIAATFAADDASLAAVTGLVLPAELDTEAQRQFEFHWGFGQGYQSLEFGPEFFERDLTTGCPTWQIGAGASMSFRRAALLEVGLFDERLDVGQSGCSGDSEAWHRILAAGYRCRYEPGIVAFHYHRREMADLRKQIFAYMRGHSSSVLVQFRNTGGRGNLKRVLWHLPRDYYWRWRDRVRNGVTAENLTLGEEVRGFLSGIWFFVRHPRSPVKARLRKP